MTDLAKLIVKLEAQTAQYHAELKKANDRLAAYQRDTNRRLASINRGFDGFARGVRRVLGGVAAAFVFRKIISETQEAQNALAQLNAVVRSTGGAAGFTVPELVAMSDEMQRTTTFADDQVQAMQALLLQFTRLSGPEFQRAQQAVADMSIRLGRDLQSSALAVGRALNDPVRGLAGLSRAGVQFSASQAKTIAALAKTGRLSEAQALILTELEKRFGGAAAAARDTFGGALTALGNAFSDLFEASDQGSSKAAGSLNRLTAILQDPAVKQAADTLLSGLITSLAWILENAAKVGQVLAGALGLSGDRVEKINRQIEFLQENLSTGAVVLGEAFGEEGLVSFLSPAEIEAQIKALIREQEALLGVGQGGLEAAKGLTAAGKAAAGLAGGGEAPTGDPEALEAIEKLVAGLRQQVATFELGAAAIARYRIEQGDLVDEFAEAGVGAVALGQEFVRLSGRLEALQAAAKKAQEVTAAREALEGMVEELREQVAVYGLGELAAMRYRLEHGRLAEQFALAGPEAAKYREELVALTAALEEKKAAEEAAKKAEDEFRERVAEGEAVFESTRTATERYAAEIIRLKDLYREGFIKDQETFNRAVAQATEQWQEAQREANKFAERATENIQDMIGSFLEDIALTGRISFDSLFNDFSRLIIRMAAQAAAARIGEALFGGQGVGSGGGAFDRILGSVGGFISKIFGFGGSAAAGMEVQAGKLYRVHPDEFFAPTDGRIVSESMEEMRARSAPPRVARVTQNIYVQGRVDQRSARQLELEALRRQRIANARLG